MLNRSSAGNPSSGVIPTLTRRAQRLAGALGSDPRTGLALVLLAMASSVLLVGYGWPYWRSADQDLVLAYQGLLFNAGLPQEYFDHPGYLSYLVIGEWYRLLHAVGVLDVFSLTTLPSSEDPIAFDAAWQRLIEAGRLLSLLEGGLFVVIFSILLRYLVGDWRVALLGAVALGFSGGIVTHIRIMRTELLSSALTTTALLLVLLSPRLKDHPQRLLALVAAGFCAAVAVIAKVQALFPVMTIPVIALLAGEPVSLAASPNSEARQGWLAAAMCLLSAAVAVPAAALLWSGLAGRGGSLIGYYPVGGGLSGVYQLALLVWPMLMMGIYARLWAVPLPQTAAAMAAVIVGGALGILLLLIRYHPQNVLAVANPIEHLFAFTHVWAAKPGGNVSIVSSALLANLVEGLGASLANHTFVLWPTHRPTLLLEWLALAGLIVCWRKGETLLALKVGCLIAVAWILDAIFWLRGLKPAYFAYTDPLLIIAAALIAARFAALRRAPWTRTISIGVFAFYIGWAHADPVRMTLTYKNPAQDDCYWLPHYLPRVERFPFCPP